MEKTVLRQMEEKDIPRIREICDISWEGQSGSWYLEHKYGLIGGRPWKEWLWDDVNEKIIKEPSHMYVTTVDNIVAGFARYGLHRDRSIGTIGYNAVDPAYRGQGIGKRQIALVMERIAEAKMVYADVAVSLDEGHAAAKKLYDGLGLERMVVLVSRYGRVRTSCPAEQPFNDITMRPFITGDEKTFRYLLDNSLSSRHHYSLMEKKYGLIGEKKWTDRLWSEIMGNTSLQIVVSEDSSGIAGACVYSLDSNREIGTVRYTLVRPSNSRDENTIWYLLGYMMSVFRKNGMKYAEISGFENCAGERDISDALCERLGCNDIIIRTEYKFSKL